MKKFWIKFICFIGLAVLPFIVFLTYGATQREVYSDSYYGEMEDKLERIKTTEGSRIVFIGGSSLAFGLRCDELEKACGMPVINFGLYGGLGTKPMMELALSNIHEGDIVILAPEIEKQTYSTMINYDFLWKCLESCSGYHLSYQDNLSMLYHRFPFIIERAKVKNLELSHPYMKECFNSYGDIYCSEVSKNILSEYYDKNQMITPSCELLDKEFIDYVNSYNKKITKKKATLFFSFSPSNDLALVRDSVNSFEETLAKSLSCDILGSILDFTYDPYYFYDTNYHLNYAGSLMHSKMVSDAINEKLNRSSTYTIEVVEPPKPLNDQSQVLKKEGEEFILELLNNTYYIVGVTDKYKDEEKLIVPSSIDGIPVVGIRGDGFKNCTKLVEVVLPETIMSLEGSIFMNCGSLVRILNYASSVPMVSASGLFDGANPEVKMYVPASIYKSYAIGYTWKVYLSYIKRME